MKRFYQYLEDINNPAQPATVNQPVNQNIEQNIKQVTSQAIAMMNYEQLKKLNDFIRTMPGMAQNKVMQQLSTMFNSPRPNNVG